LTSHTPGGQQPETVAASVSDRLSVPRSASAVRGDHEGSDRRETADTNERGRGLEGIKTHGRNVRHPSETGAGATDSSADQRLEVDRPGVRGDTCSGWAPSHDFGCGGGEHNGKKASAAVTRHSCRRGANLRRVVAARIRSGPSLRGGIRPAARRGCLVHLPLGERETQRTPCLVPGCNKPGPCGAEKPAEVVRNHEGGTRCRGVAATARWKAFGLSWSGPLQVPEKGTLKDRVRGRQDRVVFVARVRAGDELQVVPLRVGRAEREAKAGGGCLNGNA
jgi:hypothetical protein